MSTSPWPENPVLVEVERSGFLESVHRGSLVVLGADGEVLLAAGAVDRPMLPRSSNKPVQATALLAAGWVAGSAAELAIAAGSHSAEDAHRERAAAILGAAGLTAEHLGCPPALPLHEATRAAWLVEGRAPDRLAMNCSGKHAAMLAACVAAGWPVEGYLHRDHPLQRAIEERLGQAAGEPVSAVVVDGCGAPQHALSPTGLARGVLSLVQAEPGSPGRAVADAMRAEPWFVAGTGREDTALMQAVPGLLVKGGADGVHVAAVPGGGAVALKLDDGGDRGRMPALAAGLRRLGVPAEQLAPWLQLPVAGGGGVVGAVRPSAALAS
ncbi:asparaginase [Blastococcus aurantiacus]|uniref:Asparaginase n=1 Tax=Blastococcus aurantiacus TaxID=1550231 RepID=A0A1G7RRM4_9ACTN|nr:asparaginase [Blastococcus aurantiacus]SDG12560.1 asparaginase [Blastococcus aurantiacus]